MPATAGSARRGGRPAAWARRAALALLLCLPSPHAQSYFDACPPAYDQVGPILTINEGDTVSASISKNETHRWVYTNYNLTTMEKEESERKLIISLEPCYGSAFLFVRKNIPCHPDPYSCIGSVDLPAAQQRRDTPQCARTHFMSDIRSNMDGSPTWIEISLSATRYYISVFATEESFYKLTVLADIGAFPRRGGNGSISTSHLNNPGEVMVQWAVAEYFPLGISDTLEYSVYAIDLLDTDTLSNPNVFLRTNKILNTVCGLENNTDNRDDRVTPDMCSWGWCNITFTGLVDGRKYAFNVIAESTRGYRIAYAGAMMLIDEQSQSAVGGGARRLLEIPQVPPGEGMTMAGGMAGSTAGDANMPPKKDINGMQVVAAVMSSVIGVVGMTSMVAAKALFSKAR